MDARVLAMRLSINVQATPAWGCSGWKVPFATYSYMQRTFTACSQRTRCANCVSGFYAAQEARQRWHCTRPPLWTDGLDSTPKRQERFRSLNGLIDARPTEHKHDDLPVT